MPRSALPAPPPVRGTSAADDMRTFIDRTRTDRTAGFVRTPHRAPIVRALVIGVEDKRAPYGARSYGRAAYADGWNVRVTYAYGWEADADGFCRTRDVKVATGNKTETGQKETRKVGVEECPPVHSCRLLLIHPTSPDVIVAGYWKNEEFDFGIHHDNDGWHHLKGVTEFGRVIEKNAPGEAHLF
jgi:hypothetical protein